MNVMMSRTSFEQTWKQVRMTQEDRDVNPMAEELPAGPHLIVKYKNYGEPYPYPLLQKARMIFENEAVEVYEFVREDLKVNQTELANVIIAELESQDTLYQHSSGFLLTKPDAGFLYANYDDAEKEKAFQGAAGREEVGWEYNFLIRAPLPISSPGEYAFSIWMYMKKDLRPLTELGLEQFNTDTVIQYDDYKSGGVLCKMTYGSWGLVENSMYVKDPKNTVVAIVRKDSKKPKWVQFDEFMIRNTNTDAYLQRDGHIIKNNRWYETDRTAQMDSVRILSLDSVLSAR